MIHCILHPQVLLHPLLYPWLERICAHFKLGEDAPAYIAGLCGQGHSQVLLGIEEERPVALMITQLPTPLMLYPTVLLAYNQGSKKMGYDMVQQAAQWLRGHGFAHFLMTNRSGRSDAAYERILRPHGKVTERATTLLVELNEEDENEVRSRSGLGVHAA